MTNGLGIGYSAALRSLAAFTNAHRGKFENRLAYDAMLFAAFTRAREMLADDATIYVRTDRRKITFDLTKDVSTRVFPKYQVTRYLRPIKGMTQTRLFGNGAPKEGEVDLVLQRA
jgi:hypothetical protein